MIERPKSIKFYRILQKTDPSTTHTRYASPRPMKPPKSAGQPRPQETAATEEHGTGGQQPPMKGQDGQIN
jgi:hypothetical protein